MAAGGLIGADRNYEGSWHGNDTVWRMCLDLQHVLHYGRSDGTFADHQQRIVITLTDAIIAGEGDGPLSPTPAGLGLMTLGTSTAAVDWVHALLMGLVPSRVPLTREAFAPASRPLVAFPPEAIEVTRNGQVVPADELFDRHGRRFRLPAGWLGHVERDRWVAPVAGTPQGAVSR
jgi:hypothetical protein